MYTEIECPNCRIVVRSEDIIPGERLASCYNCAKVFDVSRDIDIRIRRKYKIYQPKTVEMLKTNQLLELDFSMSVPDKPLGCSFGLAFSTVAGFLTLLSLLYGYFDINLPGIPAKYGVLWKVLPKILFVSILIAGLLRFIRFADTGSIKAEFHKLVVSYYNPNRKRDAESKPMMNNLEFDSSNIAQYCVVERYDQEGPMYLLQAIGHDGEEVEIISQIKNLQTALFLEQELEDFYNLKDEKINIEVKA